MLAKRLKEEYGYSLVEVMASIMILALAILPMMAMFDSGLRSATTGSNYDKSRTLANLKLEQAKNLPFDTLRDNFPEDPPTTTTYNGSGFYQSDWMTDEGEDYWDPPDDLSDFANLEYRVEKQYMALPPPTPASASADFDLCDPATTCVTGTDLIRVTVTVRWANGNEYTTYGLVSR